MAETKKTNPELGPEANIGTALSSDDAPVTKKDKNTVTDPTDSGAATSDAEQQVAPVTGDAPTDPPAPIPRAKWGGFLPALLGGVLAAFLGFFVARSEMLESFLPGVSDKTQTAEALAALRDSDASQTEALAALRAQLAAFDQPDLGPITAQQTAFQAAFSRLKADMDTQQAFLRDLESRIAPLAARLETLEMRPVTDNASAEAIAAYDRELAALQQAMAGQRAEVEAMVKSARATEDAARTLEQDAAVSARNAQNQATIARLRGALDGGAAYAPILAELVAAGVDVPSALSVSASDGVATLAALSDMFPASARAALAAARADAGDGGGIGGFLQRQLGARSVQPRQGDDADAILSRAEAAVNAGNLATALEEVSALPEAARVKMQAWADAATVRLQALQAADELAQGLNTN